MLQLVAAKRVHQLDAEVAKARENAKPVVEDATFGFRAAAPALSCNESYFTKKIIHWDPINMKLK